MVTLALAASLAALAVPGLAALVRDVRQSGYVTDVVAFLNYARSEAIKRNCRVTVCPSTDLADCSKDNQWQFGWIAFEDSNGNGTVDGAETILRVHGPLARGYALTGNKKRIVYQGSGFTPGYNATITLCDPDSAAGGRGVIVNFQGRVRVATDADCS
jgi:type IV fimbrial biogenesis protein FimT